MTSRNSFFKLMKEDLRQRLWTIVLACVVFLLPMPIYLAMTISNQYTEKALSRNLFTLFGTQNIWIILVTCAGALICAASGFGYLFSKKKTDFFHSLPVKREKLFAVRYVNGILIYLIPYVAMLLVCLVIMLVTGSFSVIETAALSDMRTTGEFFRLLFKGFVINFAGFLTVYTALILCVTFVGNIVVYFAVSGWLFAVVSAAILLFVGFENTFFHTYSGYGNDIEMILHRFRFLSPGYFYIRLIGGTGEFGGTVSLLLQQLGFTAVLAVIALWAYKVRPSDGAGKAIAFPILKPIIRGSVELIAGAGLGLCFYMMTDEEYIGWLIFGAVLGVVLCHMFIQSVFYYDIRKCFAQKASLGVFAALAVGFVLIMRYDVFGYDTYLPKEKKIESVGIELRMDGYRSAHVFDGAQMQWVSELDDMKLTNIGQIYPYLEALVQDSEEYWEIYDKQEYAVNLGGYNSIDVAMRLENGKIVYRRYRSNGMREEQLAFIFENEEYKQCHYADIYTMPAEALELVTVQDAMNVQSMVLNQTEREEFITILRRELSALTLREKFHTVPIAVLNMEVKNPNPERVNNGDQYERDTYFAYNSELPIYASYTETLRFLKERGFDPEKTYEWTGEEKMYLDFPETWRKYKDENGIIAQYNETVDGLIYGIVKPDGTDMNAEIDYYIRESAESASVDAVVDYVISDSKGIATLEEAYYNQIPIAPEDMPRLYELCTWENLYDYDIQDFKSQDCYFVRLQVPVDGYNNYESYYFRIDGDEDLSFLFK